MYIPSMTKRTFSTINTTQVYALLQPDCVESGLVEHAIAALRAAGFTLVRREEVSLLEADLKQMYHRYFVEHKAFANKLLKLHIGHKSIVLELNPPEDIPNNKLFNFVTRTKRTGTPDGKPSIRERLGSESKIKNRIHMPGSAKENRTLRDISLKRSKRNYK